MYVLWLFSDDVDAVKCRKSTYVDKEKGVPSMKWIIPRIFISLWTISKHTVNI